MQAAVDSLLLDDGGVKADENANPEQQGSPGSEELASDDTDSEDEDKRMDIHTGKSTSSYIYIPA